MDPEEHPVHPLGSRARVLLVGVFGPYAQDDVYGSRIINPMELFHNQVTRVQHAFSFRAFHQTWGLMFLQVNLKAPVTLLDFPSEARFVEELKKQPYDVIGIGSITTNLLKVRRMCRLIRKHQPGATIVVGGHIANATDLRRFVPADHYVTGEGVRWMRRFLGEDENQPIRHPLIWTNVASRVLGLPLGDKHHGLEDATLIPGVGCPMGCNFCSTSALFGGKGKSIDFYQTGAELFEVMCDLEKHLDAKGFFVMDENFLLNKRRALELLDLMERHGKPWYLKVFSSVDVLRKWTPDQLVALGVAWIWMGLEGENAQYRKLAGTDTRQLVRSLQEHGIRILGSSIIGLENHTPENIDEVIDYAVSHDADMHQFMLYTPIPGTPFYDDMQAKGLLTSYSDIQAGDIHGQRLFNYRHQHITDGAETRFLQRAFDRDFQVNGPSIVRIARTLLRGWKRHKDDPNARIRARFAYEADNLPVRYAAAVWAARERYRADPHRHRIISEVLEALYAEFGRKARRSAPVLGRHLYHSLCCEEQRLQNGWTYEPPTFYITNSEHGPEGATHVVGV
jgi:radical SAM superfamily enzyme YgiQ (UPF0313 family)